MNKLTDLEICKRIAEIEGIQYTIENPRFGIEHVQPLNNTELIYDPLTDDALCFQLMVKYKIDVLNPCKFVNAYVCFKSGNAAKIKATDKNPNKAICLTIIEAHKND
jgi:hypothetical protein